MCNNIKNGQDYVYAKEKYKSYGVDTDKAIDKLMTLCLSIHCWQGDDVTGLESDGDLTGGIAVTGNYPGKARNGEELRADIDKAFSLIPGKKKLNLHAMYAEFDGARADRDEIGIEHFSNWLQWAKQNDVGLDFNPTYFSHDKLRDGLTIAHPDKGIRKFWVEHSKRTREIGAQFGKELGQTCVNNIWIPDGMKDTPADRLKYRQILKDSLDEIFEQEFDKEYLADALESKLFGIGSESFVVGSSEFYLGYAVKNNKVICLDSGHYHPTETIADKISSCLLYLDKVLLHVSRGVRWDSDHVTALTEDTMLIARECVRSGMDRVYCATDYFDASINRIAAWVIGSRAFLRAMLLALLEMPAIKRAEDSYDFTTRFALMEEQKQLPWGLVWDEYCRRCGVPLGFEWIDEVRKYEEDILSMR